jgi:hypothetical protein
VWSGRAAGPDPFQVRSRLEDHGCQESLPFLFGVWPVEDGVFGRCLWCEMIFLELAVRRFIVAEYCRIASRYNEIMRYELEHQVSRAGNHLTFVIVPIWNVDDSRGGRHRGFSITLVPASPVAKIKSARHTTTTSGVSQTKHKNKTTNHGQCQLNR